MPASVTKKFKQLKIRFIEATNLPKLDLVGTIEAFMECEYRGNLLQTEWVKGEDKGKEEGICASINQEMWFPI